MRAFLALILVSGALANPTPAPQSDQCALTCKESSKFRYIVGKTYTYGYESANIFEMEGAAASSVGIHIDADVDMHVISTCEMQLTFRNVRLRESKSSARKSTSPAHAQLKSALEASNVRFSFQDGKIEHVCPEVSDQREALNVRRAFLSALQNTMDEMEADGRSLETDVSGTCIATYSTEGRFWSSEMVVKKSKSLNKCRHRTSNDSLINPVTYYVKSPMQSAKLITSEQECTQRMRDGIMRGVTCEETHSYRPHALRAGAAQVLTSQTLSFKRAQDTTAPLSTGPVTSRLPLIYDHGNTQDDAEPMSAARSALDDVTSGFSANEEVDVETPRQLLTLVKRLRALDVNKMERMSVRVQRGRVNNPEVARRFFQDALPFVETPAALRIMTQLIRDEQCLPGREQAFIRAVSFYSEPSEEALFEATQLLKLSPPRALLGVSAMAHNLCRRRSSCADLRPVQQVVERLQELMGFKCAVSGSQEHEQMITVLKAVGNVGEVPSVAATLLRCITDSPEEDIRVAALQAFRRLPCPTANVELMSTLRDVQPDAEVRIAAYLARMRCADSATLEEIKTILEQEKVNQVGSFIWTHLKNLGETASPLKQEVRKLVNDITLSDKFDIDKRKFSRNIEKSLFAPYWNMGANIESNIILSPRSFIPRSANLNITVDLFGHSINLFELGLRGQGLEGAVEQFFRGYRRRPRTDAQSDSQLSNNVQSSNVESDPFRLAAFLRLFGNDQLYSEMSELPKFRDFDVEAFLEKLATGVQDEVLLMRSTKLFQHTFSVPTATGLPLDLDMDASATASLKYKGKVDLLKIFPEGKVDIEGSLSPSASILLRGSLSTSMFGTRSGGRVESTIHSATAYGGKLFIKHREMFQVRIDMPKEKQEIISVRQQFFNLYKGEPSEAAVTSSSQQTRSVCSPPEIQRALGTKLCLRLQYHHNANPWKVLSAPLLGEIYLEKTDSHTAYEMTFEAVKGQKSTASVVLDTPGSNRNRRVSGLIEVDDNEFQVSLQSPWKRFLTKGQMQFRSRNTALSFITKVDGQKVLDYSSSLLWVSNSRRTQIQPRLTMASPYWENPIKISGEYLYNPSTRNKFQFKMENVLQNPLTVSAVMAPSTKGLEMEVESKSQFGDFKVTGEYNQRGRVSTVNAGVEYQLSGAPSHSINLNGRLRNLSSRRLVKAISNVKFTTTQFPAYNFGVEVEHEHDLSHADSTLQFSHGADLDSNAKKAYLHHRYLLNTNSQNLKFEKNIALKIPQLDFETSAEFKLNGDASDMLLNAAIKYSGEEYKVEFTNERQGSGFNHNSLVQWGPGRSKKVSTSGRYRFASQTHRVTGELQIPEYESFTIIVAAMDRAARNTLDISLKKGETEIFKVDSGYQNRTPIRANFNVDVLTPSGRKIQLTSSGQFYNMDRFDTEMDFKWNAVSNPSQHIQFAIANRLQQSENAAKRIVTIDSQIFTDDINMKFISTTGSVPGTGSFTSEVSMWGCTINEEIAWKGMTEESTATEFTYALDYVNGHFVGGWRRNVRLEAALAERTGRFLISDKLPELERSASAMFDMDDRKAELKFNPGNDPQMLQLLVTRYTARAVDFKLTGSNSAATMTAETTARFPNERSFVIETELSRVFGSESPDTCKIILKHMLTEAKYDGEASARYNNEYLGITAEVLLSEPFTTNIEIASPWEAMKEFSFTTRGQVDGSRFSGRGNFRVVPYFSRKVFFQVELDGGNKKLVEIKVNTPFRNYENLKIEMSYEFVDNHYINKIHFRGPMYSYLPIVVRLDSDFKYNTWKDMAYTASMKLPMIAPLEVQLGYSGDERKFDTSAAVGIDGMFWKSEWNVDVRNGVAIVGKYMEPASGSRPVYKLIVDFTGNDDKWMASAKLARDQLHDFTGEMNWERVGEGHKMAMKLHFPLDPYIHFDFEREIEYNSYKKWTFFEQLNLLNEAPIVRTMTFDIRDLENINIGIHVQAHRKTIFKTTFTHVGPWNDFKCNLDVIHEEEPVLDVILETNLKELPNMKVDLQTTLLHFTTVHLQFLVEGEMPNLKGSFELSNAAMIFRMEGSHDKASLLIITPFENLLELRVNAATLGEFGNSTFTLDAKYNYAHHFNYLLNIEHDMESTWRYRIQPQRVKVASNFQSSFSERLDMDGSYNSQQGAVGVTAGLKYGDTVYLQETLDYTVRGNLQTVAIRSQPNDLTAEFSLRSAYSLRIVKIKVNEDYKSKLELEDSSRRYSQGRRLHLEVETPDKHVLGKLHAHWTSARKAVSLEFLPDVRENAEVRQKLMLSKERLADRQVLQIVVNEDWAARWVQMAPTTTRRSAGQLQLQYRDTPNHIISAGYEFRTPQPQAAELELSLSQPATDLDLSMTYGYQWNSNGWTVSMNERYKKLSGEERELKNFCSFDNTLQQLHLHAEHPLKKVDISTYWKTSLTGFQIGVNNVYDDSHKVSAEIAMDRRTKSFDLKLKNQPGDVETLYHVYANMANRSSAVVEAYHTAPEGRVSDAHALIVMSHQDQMLRSHITWRPESWEELKDYINDRRTATRDALIRMRSTMDATVDAEFNGRVDKIRVAMGPKAPVLRRAINKSWRKLSALIQVVKQTLRAAKRRNTLYLGSMMQQAQQISSLVTENDVINNLAARVGDMSGAASQSYDNFVQTAYSVSGEVTGRFQQEMQEWINHTPEKLEQLRQRYATLLDRASNKWNGMYNTVMQRPELQQARYAINRVQEVHTDTMNGLQQWGSGYTTFARESANHVFSELQASPEYQYLRQLGNTDGISELIEKAKQSKITSGRGRLNIEIFLVLNPHRLRIAGKLLSLLRLFTKAADTVAKLQLPVAMRPSLLRNPFEIVPPFRALGLVSGDQHFVTFDGRAFDFKAPCSYILARDVLEDRFSVIVNFASRQGEVRRQSLTVMSGSASVVITRDGRVKIGGYVHQLPTYTGNFRVWKENGRVHVRKLNKDLEVACNEHTCAIYVSGWMFGRTAGLLGVYNNEQYDDLMTPRQELTGNLEDFAAGWTVGRTCSGRRNLANPSTANSVCAEWFDDSCAHMPVCSSEVRRSDFSRMCQHQDNSGVCTAIDAYVTACKFYGSTVPLPPTCQ